MRLATLFAAVLCIGFAASADGVSRKAVSNPDFDRLTATSGPAGAANPAHERYKYRHGATYSVGPGSTADACEITCGEDAVCQAWSFVEAYGGAEARCELKRGGGRTEENLLATSGISPRIHTDFWDADLEADPVPAEVLVGDDLAAPAEPVTQEN